MKVISVIMACFSLLGALDLIFGNRLKLGTQFERGVRLIATMTLSMAGMIVMAPLIAKLLYPALNALSRVVPFDPSTVAGSLLANDMGGAPLAVQFAKSESAGYFNGLIVGSMTGATISFTLPYAMNTVQKERHERLLLGLMCGIVTVPLGALAAGLMLRMPVQELAICLIPLLLFTALLAFGILKAPNVYVKIFNAFGIFIKAVVIAGLAVGIFGFLTGWVVPNTAPLEEAMGTIIHIAAVMSGAFPLVYLLSKLLEKPLDKLGAKIGIDKTSALGFVSTLATSVTAFESMKDMNDKGVVLNAAFSVSAAFVFADHMAFTLSFNAAYLPAVIVGKLVAGLSALFVAALVYKRIQPKKENTAVA